MENENITFNEGHISDTDDELLFGIDGRTSGWTLYESNKFNLGHLQVIFSKEFKLAAVVFIGRAGGEYSGPGAGGHIAWTVADSLEDAIKRITSNNMTPPD